MKITIDVSTMQNRFAACGRDYYSWEGYEALLAYYADRKAYIENEHICPMIRKRRYPIHNNTVC